MILSYLILRYYLTLVHFEYLLGRLSDRFARVAEVDFSRYFWERIGKKAMKSGKTSSSMRQLDLSISASCYVVAITEQDRILLVRASDGSILIPSIYALQAGRLLRTDTLEDNEVAYMSLEQASLLLDVITHDDIVSMAAASYSLH